MTALDIRAERFALWASMVTAVAVILREILLPGRPLPLEWIFLALLLACLWLCRPLSALALRLLAAGLGLVFCVAVTLIVQLLYVGSLRDQVAGILVALLALAGLRFPTAIGLLLLPAGLFWSIFALTQATSFDPASAVALVILPILPLALSGPLFLMSAARTGASVRRPIRRKRH